LWNILKIKSLQLLKNARYSFFILNIFVLSLYSVQSYSQQLKGEIRDDVGQPIPGINVIVKKMASENKVFKYAISDDNGYYSILFDSKIDSFFVEFKSFSYKTKTIKISGFSPITNPYILNVKLENDLTKLEEVIVKSEKRPITVKNDTTSYDLSKFKDGTEKVIEDLIKKLPGIKVKENGTITFKGKTVERVLLDGDDLFNANYTIGTKNIDVEMVNGLSAIENYVKNPMLKGIENLEMVAINLELKPGKTDFSNNTILGLGIESKADVNTNLLGVSKHHKSFSVVSYNNIGKGYSPYNSFSSNGSSLEDSEEEALTISDIIQEGKFTTGISEERSRIGDNFFTSVNSIYNITKKLKGKLNVDYTNDRFEQSITNQTNYINLNNSTDIFQIESIEKKPELYNVKLDLVYKLSDKDLLESNTKIKNQNSNSFLNLDLNDSLQESSTHYKNKQIRQIFNLTKRLNKNIALSSKLLLNKSELTQDLFVYPDLRISDSLNSYPSDQSVRIKKDNVNFNVFYLQSGQDYNLKIGTGFAFEKTDLFSLLTYADINPAISANNLSYTKLYPWLEIGLVYKLNKWRFRPTLQTRLLSQKYENRNSPSINKKENNIQFLPKIDVIYSINKISSLTLMGRYDEKPVTENRLFEEIIFTSNRNAQKNVATLAPLKSYDLDLRYNHNDFFNLFQFETALNYSINKNSYFNIVDIHGLFTVNSNILVDDGSESINFYSNVDKYVGFLKSNVRFNISYNHSTYKNRINDSEIRDNSVNSVQSELNIKTGFLGILNFENNFQYRKSIFQEMNEQSTENASFQNSFKVYLKPFKQIRFTGNMDYHVPNVANFQSFIFFDTAVTFTSKNGNFDYSLISKNITPNKSTFNTTDITDYSVSTFSYRLQNPYFLFSVSFKL